MTNTTPQKVMAAGMRTQAATTTPPDNYTATLVEFKRKIDEVKALIPAYLADKAVING